MTKDDFNAYLLSSAYLATKLTQPMVKERLTFDFRFTVKLNASYGVFDDSRFRRFPMDDGKILTSLTETETADILVRDEYVPVWIDINVSIVFKGVTILDLFCAENYSNKMEDFYYSQIGHGPFGIKSPPLPANWQQGEKFWLGKRKGLLW